MNLATLSDKPFTYREVGATAAALPDGYHHLRKSAVIGRGRERFEEAGARVLRWGMLRGAGLRVTASAEVAEPGAVVIVGMGPVRAPCRVVYVLAEPNRQGFGYGTLAGHPVAGEELFAVRYDPATDSVFAEVTAFSRHATWWSRAGAPVTAMVQRVVTTRYLRAV